MPVVDREIRRAAASRSETGEAWRPPVVPPPWRDNGDGPDERDFSTPFSNARLGMLALLAAETMFFGGLIVAFLLTRFHAAAWPPPDQPRLPVGVTALNTLVLLSSSYTFARALRAVRRGNSRGLVAWLGRTGLLGALFLAVQGGEWARLVRYGLTVTSGVYGATFYTLIGIHGTHVLGAVVWLAAVWVLARRGRFTRYDHTRLSACAMYWHFVVALWPILYVLVYLA